MTTMTDIVRERYETGAYGGAHFHMAEATWLDVRAARPSRSGWLPAPAVFYADLLSIPVVFDADVPAREWRLIDTRTGALIASGAADGAA